MTQMKTFQPNVNIRFSLPSISKTETQIVGFCCEMFFSMFIYFGERERERQRERARESEPGRAGRGCGVGSGLIAESAVWS